MNLLEIPDSGKILFEGEDITAKGVNIDLHRQKMGMVFQHFNVFPHMTVGENITMAPVLLGKKKQNEAVEMAKELLNKVGPVSYTHLDVYKRQDFPMLFACGPSL